MGLVAAPRMLVAGKLRVPALPGVLVERPRVEGLIAASIERYPAVFVVATAGAGKTTALVRAARLLARPVAWLTVGDGDVAAGRLLEYLGAAISAHVPAVGGLARSALAAGVSHDEVAGLLAEAVGEERLLLVVDEAERLEGSEASLGVIGALLRYASPGMRVALASRRELPLDVAALRLSGRAGTVDERDLAMTEAEAAEALRMLGSDADPRRAIEATGGWVAGVMFEAWRSGGSEAADGGLEDPLHGYLARNIVAQLSAPEYELLMTTSVLREVTAARAGALGVARAPALLVSLRARHLPATWISEPLTMRCHPRFREFLLETFTRQDEGRVAGARRDLGRLMHAEGHDEEAVEAFLAAGAFGEGRALADGCIVAIVERLDFDVAERWLGAFAGVRGPAAPGFVVAELMICSWNDDLERGVELADRLRATGERDGLARSSPMIAALLAKCYGSTGLTPGEARLMLELAGSDAAIDAVRYTLTIADDELADPDAVAPSVTGGPLDVGILRAHYHRGELALLAEEPAIPWEVAVEPWRILALGALGQTGRALERYERASLSGGAAWMAGVELMIDVGRYEQAAELLALAPRQHSPGRFDPLVSRAQILEAKLALRRARDTGRARRYLERVLRDPRASTLPFLREHADTWLGLVDLVDGRDGDALARLRRTVARMVRSGVQLLLPAAAVYLAEAEWRAGEEDRADGAADAALGAADFEGSNHVLLQALADFPAVAWRRADAEPRADSAWHRFARALRAPRGDVGVAAAGTIELIEFGDPHLLVDGREVRPKLTKALSLLALLAAEPAQEVPRRRAIDDLFDSGGAESTASYLRLAARAAHAAVAPEAEVLLDRDSVRCRPTGSLESESARFDAQLTAADPMAAAERLDALSEALDIYRRGSYLGEDRSPWASDRRTQLADLAERALLEAAAAAYELGRYRQAELLARDGLARNRFRESGWRLLMRVAAATHDGDGVIEAFRGAERALAELGTKPGAATVALLGDLRR